MIIVRRIISLVTTLVLVVLFVGAGFLVCVTPPVTHSLATVFCNDGDSPFSRNQLVSIADATRDYSFGQHSKSQLYQAIYDLDKNYLEDLADAGAHILSGLPRIEDVSNTEDIQQLEKLFEGGSEQYCYSSDTLAHLDDCYAIASVVYPLLMACALIALVGLVFSGLAGNRRTVGTTLMAAGAIVLLALIACAIWAAIDFNGFFAAFHSLFFKQASWIFPENSLLICALPTAFWTAMGCVWLLCSVVLSLLAFTVGKKIR